MSDEEKLFFSDHRFIHYRRGKYASGVDITIHAYTIQLEANNTSKSFDDAISIVASSNPKVGPTGRKGKT